MTFKELLNNNTFDEVAPYIVRMCPENKYDLGWFHLHFDMLRLMTPKYHEGSNADTCHITMKDYEDGTGSRLHAYPMEGDFWEHSLMKELIIAPDVKATNAEIAACCIWHTSFYGFTETQVKDRFRFYGNYEHDKMGRFKEFFNIEILAKKNFEVIRRNGGHVPSLRDLSPAKKKAIHKSIILYGDKHVNKIKRKMLLRKKFMEKYYERMLAISDFIVKVIPALSNDYNYLSVEELCGLFNSTSFCTVEIPSYADVEINSAAYLREFVQNHLKIRKMENVVLYYARGSEYDVLCEDGETHQYISDEERQLYDAVCEASGQSKFKGTGDLIIDVVPELGRQCLICIAAYDGKPITEDNEKEKEN